MGEGRRLRVVPDGAKRIVELSVLHHRLPLPLLYALKMQLGAWYADYPPMERTAPDTYRMPVLHPSGPELSDPFVPSPLSFVLPNPGPRYKRTIEAHWRHDRLRTSVFEIKPEHLACLLVACGWRVEAPPPPEKRPRDRRPELWEAPDGFGDPHYVARWAREEDEG